MLATYYKFLGRLVFFMLGHLLASSAIHVKYNNILPKGHGQVSTLKSA